MSAKRRKFDTRTILIVLLVIVIIAAAYITITNLPAAEDTLTPEEVINNQNQYLDGESIIVKGLYDVTTEGSVIVTTMDTTAGRDELRVDLTSATGETPIQGQKYKFTGILKYLDVGSNGLNPLILEVENIEIV